MEAAGEGVTTGRHAATLTAGRVGVLHGMKSYVSADEHGQVIEAHSISAGLDYPGVGPEHAWLETRGAHATLASTTRGARRLPLLARPKVSFAALESSHAVAHLTRWQKTSLRARSCVVCLSGRGDKDLESVASRGTR